VAAAEQAGLDGEAVRRAAAIRPLATGGLQRVIFGGPTSLSVRASLDAALPADAGSSLAEAAELVTGRSGKLVRAQPGAWAWESQGGLGHTRAVVEDGEPHGTLTVRGSRADVVALTYFVMLVALGAVSASLDLFTAAVASAGPIAGLLGLFGIPLVLTRVFIARSSAAWAAGLEHLTMELLRVAQQKSREQGPALPGGEDQGADPPEPAAP